MPRTSRTFSLLAGLVGLSSCGGDSPTDNSLDCSGGSPLSIGAGVTGTLQAGDALDIDGAYLDRYALEVGQTGTVRITMTSAAVDAFLWLRSPSGSVLTADDDSGGGSDARITQSLSRGCYLVEATTFFEGETGGYNLIAENP
jgi:hypothetical protein